MSTTIRSPGSEPLRTFLGPAALARDLWLHRGLIGRMAVREFDSRYKGSTLGMLWSFLHPLVMLAVYTFVFSEVFRARWSGQDEGDKTGFALALFAGLIVFNLFSECVGRAPAAIFSQVNYVKKVVFPLQAIPFSICGSVLCFAAVNTLILLLALLALGRGIPATALAFPLVLLPALFFATGLSFFLASIGVFLRDTGYLVQIGVQILFFLTPLFYPIDAVPPRFRALIRLNPLSNLVDAARESLVWGEWPDWGWFLATSVVSALCLQLGYAWFMKTRKGFADVL